MLNLNEKINIDSTYSANASNIEGINSKKFGTPISIGNTSPISNAPLIKYHYYDDTVRIDVVADYGVHGWAKMWATGDGFYQVETYVW